MVKVKWESDIQYSLLICLEMNLINLFKRNNRNSVKNSLVEEFEIPKNLDLLNKWTIPKIQPKVLYELGTFEEL